MDKYVKFIQSMSGRHSVWRLWSDFVEMLACAIQMPLSENLSASRLEGYQKIFNSYTTDEIKKFDKLMDMIVEDMEKSTECDILGEIYMSLRLFSKQAGQYFTPYPISELMSQMVFTAKHEFPMIFYEPTCGSGVNIIAYANELKRHGINYQKEVYFVAQDLDPLVAMMCYIQMSLMGMAGVVIIGDTLKGIDGELLYTPFHYINGPRIMARFMTKEAEKKTIISTKKDYMELEDIGWIFELIGDQQEDLI